MEIIHPEKALAKTEPLPVAPLSTDPTLATLQVIERAAARPDVDVAKMRELLELQKDIMRIVAKQEYAKAMCRAQHQMPDIPKTAMNSSTRSFYAQLETVQRVIQPVIAENGFSLSFGTDVSPVANHVRITCQILHEKGHSELRTIDFAVDNIGPQGKPNKTLLHGEASAISYGERYLTCLIFNVRLSRLDDDGNRAQDKPQQGPSAMVPNNNALRELAKTLWAALKPVRGSASNWICANEWLWANGVIDDTEAAPHFSPERFQKVIDAVRSKLK